MKIVIKCGRIAAEIARFNSINSEITWRKFTKFGCDVPWLLLLNLLKVDLRSANPLSNAEAKSNGHSIRRLQSLVRHCLFNIYFFAYVMFRELRLGF